MTGCGTNTVSAHTRSRIMTAGSKKPDVAIHCPWKKYAGLFIGSNRNLRFPAN